MRAILKTDEEVISRSQPASPTRSFREMLGSDVFRGTSMRMQQQQQPFSRPSSGQGLIPSPPPSSQPAATGQINNPSGKQKLKIVDYKVVLFVIPIVCALVTVVVVVTVVCMLLRQSTTTQQQLHAGDQFIRYNCSFSFEVLLYLPVEKYCIVFLWNVYCTSCHGNCEFRRVCQ